MRIRRIFSLGVAFILAFGIVAVFGLLATNAAAPIEDHLPSTEPVAPDPAPNDSMTNTLSIEPASMEVVPGDTFTISVVISNVQDLGGLEYTLEFSPSVVQVAGAVLGVFPGSSGRNVGELGPTIDNVEGSMDHGFFSLGSQPGPSGNGIIATITFTATSWGSSTLDLTEAQVVDTSIPVNVLTPTLLFDGSLTVRKAGVTLSPGEVDTAAPGKTITYTHLLTNTGNGTDTFRLSTDSSQGWIVSHSPNPTLASGASITVFVTVTVPTDAKAGNVDKTSLTATSQFDSGVSAVVTDTTTVDQLAGLSLSPDHVDTAAPGKTITYTHLLTNTGNGTDTFRLSTDSSQGWIVSHSPNPMLASGASITVFVTVTVPADAGGVTDVTTFTAVSRLNPSVSADVFDITTVDFRLYLPIIIRN